MIDIRLINLDDDALSIIERDTQQFILKHRVQSGVHESLIRDVAMATRKFMRSIGGDSRWFGYLVIDASTEIVVGTCAFKGPPNRHGTVELSYFTFPDCEGKGYATAMARELIRTARASQEVHRIIAHTLPGPNASTRVLQKVGMEFEGEVLDPQDGRVWRWFLEKHA